MSEPTIDSLPEEVLIEIFKLLGPTSLKKVVLTCKKWKDICEPNVPWRLEILSWYDYVDEYGQLETFDCDFEELQSSQRMYTSITLSNNNFSVDAIIKKRMTHGVRKALRNISPKVVTLKFNRIVRDLQDFAEFLNFFPNVTKIRIENDERNIPEAYRVIEDPPLFRYLTDLEADISVVPLEIFKNAQLTSLTLKRTFGSNPLTVKEFLMTQRKLKKLKLIELDVDVKLPDDKVNIPFELKELALDFGLDFDYDFDHCWDPHLEESISLNFMELQSKSVETLKIMSSFRGGILLDDSLELVLKLIMAKFTNLKTLDLSGIVTKVKVPSFYGRLEENTSVTTLTISHHFSSSSIKYLFKLLPNIENLVILGRMEYETFRAVAENLKKLKTMRIDEYRENLFNNLNFSSLEALSIGSVYYNLESLFKSMAPALKHLYIHRFGEGIGPVDMKIEKLLQNFKLESLTINRVVYVEIHFFDAVRQYGTSLKSLNLNKRSLVFKSPPNGAKVGRAWDWLERIQISEWADVRGLRLHDKPINDPYLTDQSQSYLDGSDFGD